MKKLLVVIMMGLLLCSCGESKITVKENIVIEYGSDIKIEDISDQEGVTLKETKQYDSKKLGQQTITIIVESDGKEIEQEVTLEVKDTKNPIITLKEDSITITQNDEFDPTSNIESVKDEVDGDISLSDDSEITRNGYIIKSDVDTSTPGEYTVIVTAYDVNGNKAEGSYAVIVEEKVEEPIYEPPVQSNSNLNNTGTTSTPQTNSGNQTNTPPPVAPTPEPEKPQAEEPHVHRGPAVENMYFDDLDELDAWARKYIREQGDKGNNIGSAYGVSDCSCGLYFIHRFY